MEKCDTAHGDSLISADCFTPAGPWLFFTFSISCEGECLYIIAVASNPADRKGESYAEIFHSDDVLYK